MTARHVVVDLLASGRGARIKAGLLVTRPGSRPMLQHFWGTVCKDGEVAYLALFLNSRCLLYAPIYRRRRRSACDRSQ
jgi:hypothetical protein